LHFTHLQGGRQRGLHFVSFFIPVHAIFSYFLFRGQTAVSACHSSRLESYFLSGGRSSSIGIIIGLVLVNYVLGRWIENRRSTPKARIALISVFLIELFK